jgi:hypothetical protein
MKESEKESKAKTSSISKKYNKIRFISGKKSLLDKEKKERR